MSEPNEVEDRVEVEVDLAEGKVVETPAKPDAASAAGEVEVETGGAPAAPAPTKDDDAGGEDPELIETRRRMEALEERVETQDVEAANRRKQEAEKKFTDALTNADARITAVAEKIADLKKQKVKALEEGKTAEQVEIDDQLADAKMEKARLEGAKIGIGQQFERFKQQVAAQPASPATKYPKAEAWAKKNRWYGDKRFATESQYAELVDKQLMLEGVDPNSDDYYKAMDERLHKRFKHLAPTASRSPVAPAGGSPPQGAREGVTNRGKVRLSSKDLETMRTFGMDPTNKEHLREFALNKAGA